MTKSKRSLRLSALNLVSLRKYQHEIELMISSHNVKILGLNETRLSNNIYDSDVEQDDFDVYRKDKDTNCSGVAQYEKSNINHKRRKMPFICQSIRN